ncbi:MAG: substrate-binding domain-containing protein, partial [Lachnospiraceae bacterium]|nr:substrate-binding domain-containing protein [Lachnospiraceae bacterium]
MEKRPEKGYANKSFRFMIVGTVIMIAAAVVTGIIFSMITRTMRDVERELTEEYDRHYVFIPEDPDSDFWQEVFEAAGEQAREYKVYLEDIGSSLGGGRSPEDLLRIAVNSKVDGIVYSGGTDGNVSRLIDKAADAGIGVVVLQNDVETSKRQCYVGLNYYELGQMYALQIEKIFGEGPMADKSVDILTDPDMVEGASNLIIMAIEDYLGETRTEDQLPDIFVTR